MSHFLKLVSKVILFIYWISGLFGQDSNNNSLRFKVAKALRTETAPAIDGILEPLVWKKHLSLMNLFKLNLLN